MKDTGAYENDSRRAAHYDGFGDIDPDPPPHPRGKDWRPPLKRPKSGSEIRYYLRRPRMRRPPRLEPRGGQEVARVNEVLGVGAGGRVVGEQLRRGLPGRTRVAPPFRLPLPAMRRDSLLVRPSRL
jgi:hypothetical protein